ncbi:MAG: N-acetylmuramoyl-L-alanine amidase [Verrucomicrobiota bacterium]
MRAAVRFLHIFTIGGLSIAFSLVAAYAAPTPVPWNVVKVGPHDYLSVENIAKFYGLPPGVAAVNKKIKLANEKGSLEFTLDSREIFINGARNWLCFPVLEKDGKYLVSRMDLAKTIEPQMRPHMITSVRKLTTVVLDPGHGGYDKGAVSKFGYEKDYALDVAKKLRPLLQAKGLTVILTRDDDTFVPLEVRAKIANLAKDAIFISIHFNATDRDLSASGFEIYCLTPRGAPSTSDDALALSFMNVQPGTGVDTHSVGVAACIYHSILGHTAEPDRGIKRARFAVLRLTQIPSVLIEGGFMTERGESRMIAKNEWRSEFARAISIGIESYRALAEKKQKPMMVADYRRQKSPAIEVTPPAAQISLLTPTRESLSLVTPPSPTPSESPSPSASETPTPAPPDEPPLAPAPSETPTASPAPSDSPSPLSLRVPSPTPTPLEIRP